MGCDPAPVPEAVPPEAPEAELEVPPPTSGGSLRGLGPHLWEASFEQQGPDRGPFASVERVSRLVWNELGVYRFESITAGGDHREERRIGRDVYRRQALSAPWLKTRDVAGSSMILGRTLKFWTQALAPFGSQAVYERLDDDVVEGRAVRVYRLRLGPPPAPSGGLPITPEQAARRQSLTVEPTALEGLVYVDQETGNRLLAEVEGAFIPLRPAGADEVRVVYRESRSLTPLPPEILVPSGPIRDLSRPGAPRRSRAANENPR